MGLLRAPRVPQPYEIGLQHCCASDCTGLDGVETSFYCHRALLLRFPYFRALFSDAFSEGQQLHHSTKQQHATPAVDTVCSISSISDSSSSSSSSSSDALPTIDLSGFVNDGLEDPRLFGVLLR